MADGCQQDCAGALLRHRQRGALFAVLLINSVMFLLIATAAMIGKSSTLLADSLDNLGDALTYLLSLYALTRSARTKAMVALFKGGVILLAAAAVGGQMLYRLQSPALPLFEIMGLFGLTGMVANLLCLYLLWRHRHDDLNMTSVWICSRNDIISNLAVMLTAVAVWFFQSAWPDLLIATMLVMFLIRSALGIIRSALREIRAGNSAEKTGTDRY